MAKSKKLKSVLFAAQSEQDEWQVRDDITTMMRCDEIQSEPKRFQRAVGRLQSTASRYGRKKSRSGGRSSSR